MNKNLEQMKISVIVPIYNAVRTLNKCLEALKNQSDSNYEVVLVDDCSTDNSPEISRKSGFKTVRLARNKGQAVARNEGVKNATGTIIAFVDSDVVVPPEWLKKYRQLLRRHPDVNMICSGYCSNSQDNVPALFAFYESAYRRANISQYITSSTSSNCVIYRDSFEEVGGYPEYYICGKDGGINEKAVSTNEDTELGFLLSEKRKKIMWSHDNPVRHYFRETWRGYLKQQIGFSRSVILSAFKFPKILFNKDTYSKKNIIPQVIIASAMHGALLGLFFGSIGMKVTIISEVVCLLFLYLFNRKFIVYLKNSIKGYPAYKIFFWLVVCRLTWLYGLSLGVKDGFLMLWNHSRQPNLIGNT